MAVSLPFLACPHFASAQTFSSQLLFPCLTALRPWRCLPYTLTIALVGSSLLTCRWSSLFSFSPLFWQSGKQQLLCVSPKKMHLKGHINTLWNVWMGKKVGLAELISLDGNRGFHPSHQCTASKKTKANHPQPQLALALSAVPCLLVAVRTAYDCQFSEMGCKEIALSWHKRLAFTGLFPEET